MPDAVDVAVSNDADGEADVDGVADDVAVDVEQDEIFEENVPNDALDELVEVGDTVDVVDVEVKADDVAVAVVEEVTDLDCVNEFVLLFVDSAESDWDCVNVREPFGVDDCVDDTDAVAMSDSDAANDNNCEKEIAAEALLRGDAVSDTWHKVLWKFIVTSNNTHNGMIRMAVLVKITQQQLAVWHSESSSYY